MYELADALKNVNIADIGEVTLTKLVRDVLNNELPHNNVNLVTFSMALRITKAIKMVHEVTMRDSYERGYNKAIDFVAGG